MKVLVTGSAGFIGASVSLALLQRGDQVVGVDNLNDYYDVSLKRARLARLVATNGFADERLDITDVAALRAMVTRTRPDRVVHLAAQAGVRYSLTHPEAYVQANLVGFANILEVCRHAQVQHLVYASTSSVYGSNTNMPFAETQNADHPLTLYAASKKANELMAHSYSHLFALLTTGLRFFTVYGPWGRPDMALFLFTRNMLADLPIDVFNYGNHTRDFTYIDDIVAGVIRVLDNPAATDRGFSTDTPTPASSSAPYRVYNIGSNSPVLLSRYIELLEENLGKKAIRNLLPMQAGDVADTFADVSALQRDHDYRPTTPVAVGVKRFVDWYRDYYKV